MKRIFLQFSMNYITFNNFLASREVLKIMTLTKDCVLHQRTFFFEFFLFLFVVLYGLQGQLSPGLKFKQLLKKFSHVSTVFGRGLDVFTFPHFLQGQKGLNLISNYTILTQRYRHFINKVFFTCSASPVVLVICRSPDSSSHLFPTSITGIPVKSPFT